MRAVVILLVLVGIVFAAMLLLGGTGGEGEAFNKQRIKDGEEEPPSWTTWFEAPFGFFAPRIERFVSGSPTVQLAAGAEAQRRLPSDPDEESRIASFELKDGPGVRITYACEPGARGPCRSVEPVTLCLGQPGTPKHSDCQRAKLKLVGAFEVGSGGGRLTFVNDSDQPITVVLRD
jgi:hypothetical protein